MKMKAINDGFICEFCRGKVGPIIYGGSYRNHCPYCLYSKHVDAQTPGDRLSNCLGLMKPIGVYTRKTGEYVLVHQCVKCKFERYNRVAGDDDFNLVTSLSTVPVRFHPAYSAGRSIPLTKKREK